MLQPIIILLLFIVVRAGDLAISASNARDFIRAIVYGIVAILALVALVLMVVH
jgi:hypothetical protein